MLLLALKGVFVFIVNTSTVFVTTAIKVLANAGNTLVVVVVVVVVVVMVVVVVAVSVTAVNAVFVAKVKTTL